MAFIHSFEQEGNWLFRHRGTVPVLLFVLALPAIYFTRYAEMSDSCVMSVNILAVILSVSGFIIRAYTIGTTPKGTSGRNTDRQVAEQLNNKGIYSIVRHPLYLGNYLMWIGIVCYTKNFSFVIIVSLLFWVYYERIMFAEERFLERKFGNAYLDWSLHVPAFIPKFFQFEKSPVSFSVISVLRREYSGVLATVLGFAYVDLFIHVFSHHEWQIDSPMLIVLISTIVVVLVLRSVKHYTRWLDEEGRS